MDRTYIADLIVERLAREADAFGAAYRASGRVRHFVVDDVLPTEVAGAIRAGYPTSASMRIKRSLRELKFIAAQMDEYNPILEEAIYAFQDPRIVTMVEKITKLVNLTPDEQLYAGGISMMVRGHYLNPHIDNSHDKYRARYRLLNLLYYVSPHWTLTNGGNLELWPDGPEGKPITVESRFNRLVVMATNKSSWHSVSKVETDEPRCCVSNYYFSDTSPDGSEYFHVTSFRGRPEQRVRDLLLRADIALRTGIRKLFPKGAVENTHFYNRRPKD